MAIARVQHKSGSASSASVTVTYTSAPIQGNLLVAVARASALFSTFTMPAGWISAASQDHALTFGLALYYKIAGVSEPTSVTFSATLAGTTDLVLLEYSGILTSGPLDKTSVIDGAGSGTSLTLATTPLSTQPNEVVVAAVGLGASSGGFANTWTNGFVQQDVTTRLDIADLLVTTTGTYSTTEAWTASRANAGVIAVLMSGALLGIRAAESDLANSGTLVITLFGVRGIETDTPRAGGPLVALSGIRALETDIATSGALIVAATGIKSTEADSAQAGLPNITIVGSQVTEIDSGNVGGPTIVLPGVQAVELDLPLHAAIQAVETDQAMSGSVTIGGTQALESDTPMGGTFSYLGALAQEVDIAMAGGIVLLGGRATETDAARTGGSVVDHAGTNRIVLVFPDEIPIGESVTFIASYKGTNSVDIVLNRAPIARIYAVDAVTGAETSIVSASGMNKIGTTNKYSLVWTPTSAGVVVVEVNISTVDFYIDNTTGPDVNYANVLISKDFAITVRPRFDPIAFAGVEGPSVLVSRM